VCIGPRIPPENAEAFLKEKYPDVPVILKYHKAEFLNSKQLLAAFEDIKNKYSSFAEKAN